MKIELGLLKKEDADGDYYVATPGLSRASATDPESTDMTLAA